MKVTRIDTFVVGPEHWHPWLFCAVRTDEGITGYAEFGEGGLARPLVALVEALAPMVIGRDPGPIERIRADMFAANRYTAGGLQSMAMAGIELALWDVKGKALGTPIHRPGRRAVPGAATGLLVAHGDLPGQQSRVVRNATAEDMGRRGGRGTRGRRRRLHGVQDQHHVAGRTVAPD